MSKIFNKEPNTSNFRIPQREGYENSVNYFQSKPKENHVLLQIPTAVGKTALIATLPFGLSEKKTLILTPNLNLSEQMEYDLDIVGNFDNSIYKKLDIFSDLENMELFVLKLDNKANRSDVDESHIIISNFQQLADVEKWFKDRADDINLIIIDEAHHQKAKTYQEIISFFPNAKVVGLTATPFRSDSKKLDGKTIYKYHFSDAVKNKYICNIKTINVSPREISLTFDDEKGKLYSLEEIIKMKEEAWFRQGIAMSQDCCNSIARKSLERLKKLKVDFPNQPHQIIATAMSIRHAREFVKPAFEKLGLKVGLVSSEHIKSNASTKEKLKQGKIDVIININMLGEGYDHKPLGVASIFRPFASLNPYIQFLGRVLRINDEVDQCYVVSHLGLNQTSRFKEFKMFDDDDRDFLDDMLTDKTKNGQIETEDEELSIEEDNGEDKEYKPPVKIKELGDKVVEFSSDFVDKSKIDKAKDGIESLSEEEKKILLKDYGVEYKVSESKKIKTVKPKDARRSAKNLLNEKEKSIAVDILKEIGVGLYGRNFNKRFTNFVWVKGQISRDINKKLGIKKNKRNDLSLPQINEVLDEKVINEIKNERTDYFRGKLTK